MKRLRERSGYERAHDRLSKRAVKCEVHLRDPRCSCEAAFIGSIIAAERANIVERARLAAHDPVTSNQIGAGYAVRFGLKHRLIKTGWQRVDQVDIAGELAVLLSGHGSGDKDAEVTNLVVDRVDDGLPVGADLVDIVVEVEDPIQRLLGWGDVVALRTERHDGRADIAKIDAEAVRGLDLACGEIVADEQLIDNELDLLGVEIDVASPIALKAQV